MCVNASNTNRGSVILHRSNFFYQLSCLKERPHWAAFLDGILVKATPKGPDGRMTNAVLQDWWCKDGKKKSIPTDVLRMFRTAEKMGTEVVALRYTTRQKMEVSVWASKLVEANRRKELNKGAKLLRKIHGVKIARQLEWLPDTDPTCREHRLCIMAKDDWKSRVFSAASAANRTPVKDGLDDPPVTPDKDDEEGQAATIGFVPSKEEIEGMGDAEWWNPDPRIGPGSSVPLNALIRIGAKPRDPKLEHAVRGKGEEGKPLRILWTDGSADKNGAVNSFCGAGVFFNDDETELSERIDGTPPSNNRGEIAAIALALNHAEPDDPLEIRSDSQYALDFMKGGWRKAEDKGYLGVENEDLLRTALYLLRQRTARTWGRK